MYEFTEQGITGYSSGLCTDEEALVDAVIQCIEKQEREHGEQVQVIGKV